MSPYLLTVAVHATVLSASCLLGLTLIRKPRAKAVVALGCLIGIGLLSWLSPLRPVKEHAVAIPVKITRLTAPESPPAIPPHHQDRMADAWSGEPVISVPVHRTKWKTGEAIIILWSAGMIAGLIGMMRTMVRTTRWKRSLAAPDDSAWSRLRDEWPDQLGRDRLRVADATISPCVAGFLQPVIVFPRSLLDETRSQELAWTLRHELAHLNGHDSRWAVAVAIVRSLFWWNPFVHGLARRWSEARELTCDLAATASGDERSDYGEFLITVAAGLKPGMSHGPAMAHATARRMKRRIVTLLAAAPGMPARLSRLQASGFVLAFAVAFGATSLLALETRKPDKDATSEAILEEILNPPRRLVVSLAMVKTREPFCRHGEILSREELDIRVNHATRQAGYELLPVQRETEDFGTPTWTRLTSPFVAGADENELPWDGKEFRQPFIGSVVGRNSRLEGESIHLSVQAAYAFAPGHHLAPGLVPEAQIPWSQVQYRQLSGDAVIPSGHAVGFSFGELEPGVHVCVVLGVAAVKPWEAPEVWRPNTIPSLSPRNAASLQQVPAPRPISPDNPVIRDLSRQRQEAYQTWKAAMDALPANAELVRQREMHQRRLAENPGDRETKWKLTRLEQAIRGNAKWDPAIKDLKIQYDALGKRMSEEIKKVRPDEFQHRIEQSKKLELRDKERNLRDMEQFDRQRHRW